MAVPESVDGRSLAPLLRGGTLDREYVHIERSGNMHALTDGHEKYVWLSGSGAEQLFDLDDDPHELHDLADEEESRVSVWRARLVQRLAGRSEEFVEHGQLMPGRHKAGYLPHAGPLNPHERQRFVV
ncbi:MAG: hypothetical protein LC725_11985 [Lentisphaerae bacterium]|nr:hypothetical protein [Lentisphaerota bacterium]